MPRMPIGRSSHRPSPVLPTIAALLVVTAGPAVAQSPSTVPMGAIDHPTGSTDVVLSMETGGGMVPFGFLVTQAPTFVLFGDSVAIFRPSTDPSGAEVPPFVRATLSAEQVDALLVYALDVGGLESAAPEYHDVAVTDVPTTVFTIDADGIARTVSVYALGIGEPTGPDAAAHQGFEDLATLLSTFEAQVERGNVLSAAPYQPEVYRTVLSETSPDRVGVIDWPWSDLTLADFEPMPQAPAYLLAGLDPAHIAAVTTVPSGGSFGIPVNSPDGTAAYLMQYTPLLPGEPLVPAVAGGKGV